MSDTIPWLPEIVCVDGEWEEILGRLYEVFTSDFKRRKLILDSKEVWHDRRKLDGAYEEGFWHLISRKDRYTGDRLLDNRRAERLPWCAPSIQNYSDANIKFWRYREGNGTINMYVWLFELDYVVILKERRLQQIDENKPARTVAFLLTAYHLDGPGRRAGFERKYNERIV